MNGPGDDIVRRRMNISSYDAPQLSTFRKAMTKFMAITDNRGYNHMAGNHGVPDWYCWHGQSSRRFPFLRTHAFLPWHRAYLKVFEDHLLDHDSNISLPWWDATSSLSHREGIPKAYKEPTVDGTPNPLYKFHIPSQDADTKRNPRRPRQLPANSSVKALYDISDFGEFSTALQEVHDSVHVWCGGSMSTQAYSAYDPVFWAHHCNIDRIWAIWQTKHGNNLPEGLPEMELEPFPYRVKNVLKIYDLGYEYAAGGSEVKF